MPAQQAVCSKVEDLQLLSYKWQMESGDTDRPKRSAVAPCTPQRAPLDVTGDKVCEGQKQATQQKLEDIDKRRRSSLSGWKPEGILRQNATSISG